MRDCDPNNPWRTRSWPPWLNSGNSASHPKNVAADWTASHRSEKKENIIRVFEMRVHLVRGKTNYSCNHTRHSPLKDILKTFIQKGTRRKWLTIIHAHTLTLHNNRPAGIV